MKKVLSIWSWAMILALCVGFSSCSNDKDDDGGSGSGTSIVGKWNFVSYTKDIKNPTNPTLESTNNILFDYERTGDVKSGDYLEITEDEGVYYISYMQRNGGSSYVGSFKKEDDYSIPISLSSSTPSGTITVKNGVLTFTADCLDEYNNYPYSGKTYREEGFTKFLLTWNFKK